MSESQPKSVYASKTVWFNILSIAAVALTAVSNSEVIADYPVVAGGVAVGISVVNVLLRLVTRTPIK